MITKTEKILFIILAMLMSSGLIIHEMSRGIEHGLTLDSHGKRLDEVETRLTEHDKEFMHLDAYIRAGLMRNRESDDG